MPYPYSMTLSAHKTWLHRSHMGVQDALQPQIRPAIRVHIESLRQVILQAKKRAQNFVTRIAHCSALIDRFCYWLLDPVIRLPIGMTLTNQSYVYACRDSGRLCHHSVLKPCLTAYCPSKHRTTGLPVPCTAGRTWAIERCWDTNRHTAQGGECDRTMDKTTKWGASRHVFLTKYYGVIE